MKSCITESASDLIVFLNKCNASRMVHFYRVCVIRAFLQATISFLIVELMVLGTIYKTNQAAAGDSSISCNWLLLGISASNVDYSKLDYYQLLFKPVGISMGVFIVFIAFLVYDTFSAFKKMVKHDFYTDLTIDNVKKDSNLIKELKKACDDMNQSVLRIHVAGVFAYTALGAGLGLYYTRVFNACDNISIDDGFSSQLIVAVGMLGLVFGLLWNVCDYCAEQRIDWLYIFSNTSLTELHAAFPNNETITTMTNEKMVWFILHSAALIISSLAYISIIVFNGTIHAAIGIDSSFISNQYLLFFITLGVFLYKYSYLYYYKNECPARKIFPYYYDFLHVKRKEANNQTRRFVFVKRKENTASNEPQLEKQTKD